MSLATLDLDLEVFTGPFDLLLALVVREEIDLMELPLVEVVLAYLDQLEVGGELDLESATEFIVLIAALLELKSRRLLLSEDEAGLEELAPEEAADELLQRMLQARRYRNASSHLLELLASEHGVRFRSVAPPAHLRRLMVAPAAGSEDPLALGRALGELLRMPPTISVRHISNVRVTLAERLTHLRELLRRGRFTFEDAVPGADRMTVAMTLFALLELYKRGEARFEQPDPFGEISIHAAASAPAGDVSEAAA